MHVVCFSFLFVLLPNKESHHGDSPLTETNRDQNRDKLLARSTTRASRKVVLDIIYNIYIYGVDGSQSIGQWEGY